MPADDATVPVLSLTVAQEDQLADHLEDAQHAIVLTRLQQDGGA